MSCSSTRLHDAIGEVAHELHGVGAVHAVDLDAVVDGDEAEHVVARDPGCSRAELVIDLLQVVPARQGALVTATDLAHHLLQRPVLR